MDPARYFDHAATTPVDPEVRACVQEIEQRCLGNPASPHRFGRAARELLESARAELCALLGAEQLVFTSGASEANNLALYGWPGAGQLLISAIEHKAVLQPAEARAAREGRGCTRLAVDSHGLVCLEQLAACLATPTLLVSVMHANNELGVVQPLAAIATEARRAGVCVHSDAAQSAGKLPIDMTALGIQALSLSGHKLGAPQGIGALALRGAPALRPLLFGGAQQGGLRPGTEDTARAVGLALALRKARQAQARENARLQALRDQLEAELADLSGPALGSGAPRLPHISALRFAGVPAEVLILRLDLAGFAISSGAACSSSAQEPSHVAAALGLAADAGAELVRISLGSRSDVDAVSALVRALRRNVEALRG